MPVRWRRASRLGRWGRGSRARLGHQGISFSTSCLGLNQGGLYPGCKRLCVPPSARGGHTLSLVLTYDFKPSCQREVEGCG